MAKEILTGLALERESIRWTRVERVRGGWRTMGSGSVPTALPADAEDDATRAETLRAAARQWPGDAVLVLPVSKILMRTLDLPSLDSGEISEMLSLQVDQFLPLPQEEMVVSHEVLRQKGDSSLVQLSAVPLTVVESAIAELNDAGANIVRVDSAALGWIKALEEGEHLVESGRQVVVVLGEESLLLVLDDAVPVLVRLLHRLDSVSVERDVASALMSVELTNGALPVLRADIVHPDEGMPEGMADAVCEACGIAVTELLSRDTLGYVAGAVARSAVSGSIDLYPPEWRTSAARKATRRKMVFGFGGSLLLWIVLMAAMFAVPYVMNNHAVALESDLSMIMLKSDGVRVIQRRTDMIKRYKDRSLSFTECLLAIAKVRPDGVTIDSMKYRYGDRLNLTGVSLVSQRVYDFKNAIEKVEIFEHSSLEGQRKERFEIEIVLPAAERGEEVGK